MRGIARTKLHAAIYAGAQVPVSLLLVPLGIAGTVYLAAVGVAGAAFAVMCIRGLWIAESDRQAAHRWARAVFFASLAYLPLLFAALAIDVAAR